MKKVRSRMGRPPAEWMFEVPKLKLSNSWTDAYEIADALKQNVKTVKSFLSKLEIKPKHEVEAGIVKARFRVSDLKKAAEIYIQPWL